MNSTWSTTTQNEKKTICTATVNLNEATTEVSAIKSSAVYPLNPDYKVKKFDVSYIREFSNDFIHELSNNASVLAGKIAKDVYDMVKMNPSYYATYSCLGIFVDSITENLTACTLFSDDFVGAGYSSVPYVGFTKSEVFGMHLQPVDIDDDYETEYSGIPKRVLVYLVYELEELGFDCFLSDEAESLFIAFSF